MSVREICDAQVPDKCYKYLFDTDSMISTVVSGIKPNVFEKKRELISRCRGSFSSMQGELMNVYAKLDEYERNYGNINRR